MTEEEMLARGQEMLRKCYGENYSLPGEVDPKNHSGITLKMFNDFWGDERLSFRDKRLIVMSVSAAMGADRPFQMHARCALDNGELSPEELRSAVLMMLPYAGYPRISLLLHAVDAMIAEREQK